MRTFQKHQPEQPARRRQGEYSVSNLAPGSYTVKPSKSKCTFSPASDKVTVGPDAKKSFKATCK